MQNCEVNRDPLVWLLARTGAGDSRAFRQLYQLTARRLMPQALRIVRRADIAEEVIQESFIAVWRDAAAFDAARSAPMTWLSVIVHHKAVDCLRTGPMRLQCVSDEDEAGSFYASPDPAAGPCELAERGQSARQIRLGLERLAPRQRQAIELAYFHELTHGEVAHQLTLPLGTVKTWIRRGCREIRQHLDQH